MGKVESPGDPPGTTTRKRNVRFTGFRALLGNKEALTHSYTVQAFTHIYWENGITNNAFTLFAIDEKTG